MGGRFRSPGDLVQRRQLRQRVGLERYQLVPQQLLWTVEGGSGVLLLEHDHVVRHLRAWCYHLPPLDPPAGDQRGSWVSSVC